MKTALFAAGLVLIAATALPRVRTGDWWIRVFDFPRTQLAALLAAVLAAFAFFLDPASVADGAFAAALAASLGYQCFRILPYTPLAAPQMLASGPGGAPDRLRLLTANVLMHNRRADEFLALVRAHDPDLVLALETDRWWDAQLSALERDYPFAVRHPLENTYGLHLFSRLPLGTPEVRFLVEDHVPSVRTAVRLRSGAWIDFHGVHPSPPTPRQDTEPRDAELLIVAREVKAAARPAIVAGDLNDVAWSHTTRLFQRISGMLDPRIGRGLFNSFHVRYPFLRWPLDHVFAESSFTLGEIERLGSFGSDHFPILVELRYEPPAADRQEAPEADRADREEARDRIEQGRNATRCAQGSP